MTGRALRRAAEVGTAVASAVYFFVYLSRWEWNRAQVAAVVFVAAEVAVVGSHVVERLRRLERQLDAGEARARRLRILREQPHRRRGDAPFAWLEAPTSMNVFVPVLMGAGLVLSALAWVVERVAGAAGAHVADHHLARELGALELPEAGLLGDDDPAAVLWGPQ